MAVVVNADNPLSELFARGMASTDRTVLVDGTGRWTGTDLGSAVAEASTRYQAAGLGSTARVGVVAWPPAEFLIDLFALARLGVTVVPLPGRPTAWELERIDAIASLTHLLRHEATPPLRGSQIGGPPRWLDRCMKHAEATNAGAATGQLTSGTSGRVRLALRPAQALAFEAAAYRDSLSLGAGDVLVSTIPLHHAYGFGLCVVAAALAGVVVRHVPPDRPRTLLQTLRDLGRVLLPTVPPIIRLLGEAAGHGIDLRGVRVVSAGARLDNRTVQLVLTTLSAELGQVYGTTETGPICIQPPSHSSVASRCVGRPLSGVDVELHPVEGTDAGMGAIAVRSPMMMLGYGDSATGDVSEAADDWFMTGDIGRWHESDLALVGRLSNCINVGGAKVSPEEVESALLEHPAVRQALVVGIPDPMFGERIKATVAPAHVDLASLRPFLRDRLSPDKRPDVIEAISSLPTTAAGKVIRPSRGTTE